jgi:undecaprenyl-diphosphatase
MDVTLMIKTVVMGLVEGVTEFVPISSTGHMILIDRIIGFRAQLGEEPAKCFEVVIQLGAILAVVVLYTNRFVDLLKVRGPSTGFRGRRGLALLAITTLPVLVAGFLLHGVIKHYLFSEWTVIAAMLVGAVGILLVERYKPAPTTANLDALTGRQAWWVGIFQCFSLWSGMSRSASTIAGGLLTQIDRRTAAEYSFLAAVPAMVAASAYELHKSWHYLSRGDIPYFTVGFIVAFLSATLAVKGFIGLLQHWTLRPFAYYRLIVGVLAAVLFGLHLCGPAN